MFAAISVVFMEQLGMLTVRDNYTFAVGQWDMICFFVVCLMPRAFDISLLQGICLFNFTAKLGTRPFEGTALCNTGLV